MNYALAREIYGLTPWFIDAHSLPGLLGTLENVSTLELPETQYNTPYLMPVNSTVIPVEPDSKLIQRPYGSPYSPGQLETAEDFEAIGIIKINGPITLNGGASSRGMAQVSDDMLKMAADSRVKGFIISANSGGGASAAVRVMSETINKIKSEKPVYGVIDSGGMAASAMYGILSAANKIYSESDFNIVGSAGTMLQFSGREANTIDSDGVKHIRIYAPKSTRKNEGFEKALNADNYKILKDSLLAPVNEDFLNLIESNRPVLKGTDFDDGHTVFSKDAIGTFIDGIKSFSEVVAELSAEVGITEKHSKSNISNKKNDTMTRSQLKSEHPELYAAVFNEGVTAESNRCGAWLAHIDTDSAAVIAGINSSEAITPKETQEFIVKQTAKIQLANLASDSAEALATAAAGAAAGAGGESETEVDAFYSALDQKLNLKK